MFLSPQVKRSAIISRKKWYVRVASRVAERLRKGQENFKTSYNYNLVPSVPPKIQVLLILAKNCWKIEIKSLPYYRVSHEN